MQEKLRVFSLGLPQKNSGRARLCRKTPFFLLHNCQPVVPGQIGYAAVIGGLCLFGKETAGNSFVVIPVVRHTGAALSMPGAVARRAGAAVFGS